MLYTIYNSQEHACMIHILKSGNGVQLAGCTNQYITILVDNTNRTHVIQ